MDRVRLLARIEVLGNEAAAWGGAIRVELGEPASATAIAHCEAKIDTALPAALVSFLRQMNGLTVYYYDDGQAAADLPAAWSETLEISSAERVATLTLGLREFFDDIAAGPRAPIGTRERASVVLVLSSEADVVTYLPLDKVDGAGNCPVMELDQEYHSQWLSEPLPDPIASSLEEHVAKSLDSLRRTRQTFMYWVPRPG